MKESVILLVCFFGLAACVPGQSLTDVIDQVVTDTDVNPTDGFISEAEFREELLARWDSDARDEIVTKQEFVHQWTSTYHDNHHDASTFFDNLDSFFPFGQLTEVDLLFHMGVLDPDGDGQVAVADFENFIRQMHPCGVHGHLGC